MKIIRSEVTDSVMPKDDPKWRFALGARPESVGVLLRVETDDGVIGFGFASETPHLGYPIVVLKASLGAIAALLVGKDPRDRNTIMKQVEAESGGCKPAVAAIGMALYDLVAKAEGVPVYRLLGGAFRTSVPILRILALKSPDETAAIAKKHVESGYRYLKIKLDNNTLELDAARIRAVREAVGGEVHLTLDANQSYSPKEAISLYRRVADQNIDLFEQPVPARDHVGLKIVTDAVDCLVEADEGAASLEDV